MVCHVKRNTGHGICSESQRQRFLHIKYCHRLSVGETLNVFNLLFLFLLGVDSFLVSVPLKISRLFIFILKPMPSEVLLCHMENHSLDLAILICKNFLY